MNKLVRLSLGIELEHVAWVANGPRLGTRNKLYNIKLFTFVESLWGVDPTNHGGTMTRARRNYLGYKYTFCLGNTSCNQISKSSDALFFLSSKRFFYLFFFLRPRGRI